MRNARHGMAHHRAFPLAARCWPECSCPCFAAVETPFVDANRSFPCRQSGAVDSCVAAFQRLQQLPPQEAADPLALVGAAAAPAGLELYRFNFSSPTPAVNPSRKGSLQQQQQQQPAPLHCSTLHGVVRSPRGDGGESFLLMLPLHSGSPRAAALAAATGAGIAEHLRRSAWLAKDALLLFTDAACGAEASAEVGLTIGKMLWGQASGGTGPVGACLV